MHKESASSTQEDVADPRVEYAVSEAPTRSQTRPPASISIMPADSMAPTQTNVRTEPSTLSSSQSVFDAPRRGNDSQNSTGSMSSYAATVRPQDEKHLPFPVPPPSCLEGQAFDCEICYRRITNVKGNRKWKQHVMQDLRPYVCTYGGCRIQDVMFASRREWFEHEMTVHYITYVCIPPCQEVFASYVEFYRHLKDSHSSSISDQQVEHIAALRKTCDFPDGGVPCPLCREPCPTMKKLEKHLGGDLEQIALFSLPPMVGNADSFDDEDDDGMDAISNASSEEMDVKDKMEMFDRKGFGGASAGTTTSSLEIQPEHVALGIPYCRRSGKPEVIWMLKNFEWQKPYSCTSLCGQKFSIKARWKAHEELNVPRAWWLCKFCADIFPRKDRLRDHKKKQHGQSKINADEKHTAKQRERFLRPCFFACGYTGDDFDQWIDHVDEHFAIDVMKGTSQGEATEAVAGNVLSILKERQKQETSIARSLELPSDILNGIGLAIQIQRTWFDKANRADSLYREFGDDIRHLSGNLEALKLAFEKGHDLSLRDGQYYDPLEDALDKDRRALVGNFEATLVDCEKLLKKNVAVSREGLSFVRNSYWHISIKPTVDALRERIKFHMIKMEFVLEPLRRGLLKDISMSINLIMATMGDLHAVLIQGTPASQLRLPQIPPWLQQRFEVAFASNQPKSFSDGSDRVIELTFDALHRTFLQSTFSYHGPSSGIQTIQQYLNLIKAQFLSEKLRKARGLSERYYYDRSARLVELKIGLEFRRDNIERYREEELEALEQGLFEIWIAHEESDSPVANVGVEVGAPSEEILVLPVINEDGRSLQNLAVVRQSEVDFLLVKRTLATATSGPCTDNYPMNIHYYRYIPWYAVPKIGAASTKVEVRNTMSMDSSFFTFKDNSDVLKFQHAVMGYHVIYDKTSLSWKFHSKDCGQNLINSQNRIQLWRAKRLSARKRVEDASASDPTATLSQSSRSNDTIPSPPGAQTDRPPATPTIASSVISESESAGNERITVIKALTAPVLFIFTMLDKKYTFIHIELTPQHRLSYQSCSCDDKKPHSCSSVAVRYTRKQKNLKFPFRIHSVEPSQLANFDLALFASQQHPGFSRLKLRETGYLNLDFTSSAERIHFAQCFNNLLEDHRAKYNAIEQHRAQRKHQSGLSGEGELDRSSGSWRSASFSLTDSSSTRVRSPASPATRLDPVPNLPELSLPYR